MEKKINVAELLKDCPTGMELDCTLYDNCTFDSLEDHGYIEILVNTPSGQIRLTKFGCYIWGDSNAKCVIFPKGKTTWEGFQIPFKDGDIIFTHANCLKVGLGNTWISIFQEKRNGGIATYVDMTEDGKDYYDYIDGDKGLLCMNEDIMRQRLATEEEKEKLFDAIKVNGYKWNAETKTLEKSIKPKFKVGNRIRNNQVDLGNIYTIIEVKESSYVVNKNNEHNNYSIDFVLQDDWELAPNKFDITTLKPFESKVLVRDSKKFSWRPALYGGVDYQSLCPFITVGGMMYKCMIPYEGNEHLLGTTNDCDEFYKSWK